MDDAQQQEIHEAVDAALDELAIHLGGTHEDGGPVVNATQIKGRGDLGILLTDADDRVLGRVWVAFGGSIQAPTSDTAVDGTLSVLDDGAFDLRAEVCSEVVEPPLALSEWVEAHGFSAAEPDAEES